MFPFVLAFLLFLLVGLLLTARPSWVREWIIDACTQGRWGFWIARETILRRVRKPAYLYELRVIGIICLLGATVCAWIIFGEKKPLS